MAETIINSSNALAWKLYSKELFVEAKKRTIMNKFVGKDAGSVIMLMDELQKRPGDQITYGLRMQLNGAGVASNTVLDGQEESLTLYYDQLVIDQMRWGVKLVGNMSQQRVSYDLREQAKSGLADWLSSRFDVVFFNQLGGNSGTTANSTGNPSNLFSGMNNLVAPDTDHHIYADSQTTESGVKTAGTAANMTLPLLNTAATKAKILSPAIRPVRIKGGEYYLCFLHPYQVEALRSSTATYDWQDLYAKAVQGGLVNGNPLFTGAIGIFNNCIMHEDNRVPYGDSTQNTQGTDLGAAGGSTTDVARAIFCGAQAAVMAFGRGYDWPNKVKWVDDMKDYANVLGVSIATVFGVKKVRFSNSVDFATIVISTYAALS